MSTCQAINKPISPFQRHYMSLHIKKKKKCVTACLGLIRVYAKKNVNIFSPVIHDEFSPAPALEKKPSLSVNLCTETQLKAFMLQFQFSAK